MLSFHTLTQNHSISANFKLSLHQSANEFPGSVLPTIESNIFRQTKHTHTLYIDMYTVCICIFQYSKWRKTVLPFSVCTFLSPPNTHFFMRNTCCHLYMGTTLFHKGPPPPQRSSIALKTNIFTKVAPQVSAVFQEPHLFFVRKGKNKENNKTNQNMKDKEQKGKERKHI